MAPLSLREGGYFGEVKRPEDINGHPGTAWHSANGYGSIAVTWSDSSTSYIVATDRLDVAEGTSGVSLTELLRVARSIR